MARTISFRYAGATDRGKSRSSNEDSFLATPQVLAVADGMGGHAAGEVAAGIVIDTLARILRHSGRREPTDALLDAIREANEITVDRANEYHQFEGMGTTVTAAVIRGDELTVAHVGDSRAYLLSEGRLRQLTEDHSLVAELVREGSITPEQAAVHPQRSVITRALGASRSIDIDIVMRKLAPGDVLLLATDGLTSVVPDNMIERTLSRKAEPAQLVSTLISQANVRGGPDNITVVVARYTGGEEPAPKQRGMFRPAFMWTVAFLLIFGAIAGAFGNYLGRNYYLAFSNDRLAVYQGIPGSVAGVNLSRVYRATTIRRADLPGYYQDRLDQTIPVTGPADADRIVKQMVLSAQPPPPTLP